MSESNRVRLNGGVIALFFLALAATFVSLHLSTPSDGARFEPGEPVWRSDGVVVTPLVTSADGLRAGDVVIAVEAQALTTFAQAIFNPNEPRPELQFGQSVKYTILRDGRSLDVDVVLGAYPLTAILVKNWSALLFTLISQIIITIVFLLRPGDRAARALFLWAWSLVHTYVWAFGLQVSDITNSVGFWLYQISASGAWLVFWSAGLEFALVFPHEHIILKKHPTLIRWTYLGSFVILAVFLASAWLVSPTRLEWMGHWSQADFVVAAIYTLLTAGMIVRNYRSTPDTDARQKIRWVVFAFFLCSGTGLILWFLPQLVLGHPLIDANGLGLSLIPFPMILAVAVLQHKLFDIDIIIRRTVTYSILSALLLTVYFGSVVLLQQLFRALTGAGGDLAIIISTLAIAGVFNPLRMRVQDVIDRHFYRRKYDAQKILAQFARTARDETDLEELTNELMRVVAETVQPQSVSIWLKRMERDSERKREREI